MNAASITASRRIKQSLFRALIGVLALLFVFIVGLRQSPETRTRLYFEVNRDWRANWPFERGLLFPLRFQPIFAPFVPIRVDVEPGVNMLLDRKDLLSRSILLNGYWESSLWERIRKTLPEGGTFVDVGAHIGYYSLKTARVVGPTGRVIAIEPNPETLEQLRANIRISQADVVDVQPVACSDVEGKVDLFAAARANTGRSSLSRSTAEEQGPIRNVYSVRARPLDAVLEKAGVTRVDVIKIDVEGAELLVLKGSRRTLRDYSPILIIEVIEGHLRAMGTSPHEVIEFLESLEYTMREKLGDNAVFSK